MKEKSPKSNAAPSGNIHDEVREIWDSNADFWDEHMGEGNVTHRLVLEPLLDRLLELKKGEEVLEVACGNGQLARHMASRGARVTACDVSEGMLRHARARGIPAGSAIEFRNLDVTDTSALRAIGPKRFHAVVCNMALMDIPEIEPLAKALPDLLRSQGRFVFSVSHPVFNSTGVRKVFEEDEETQANSTDMPERSGVFVYRYGTPTTAKGLAMIGQPKAQYYFDRSISDLLRPFFQAGLRLDAFEELVAPAGAKVDSKFSWANFPQIPYVLVGRFWH
jgi:SAM-dependent methyltransferase